MSKAKVFLVHNNSGMLIGTRVVTVNSVKYLGVFLASFIQDQDILSEGIDSAFYIPYIVLTPEHQAEDFDLEQGNTSVLVATIDI